MRIDKRYYSVTAKCGHVGKNFYIPIEFAVYAENGKSAAALVRKKPRVKRHHLNAIIKVRAIEFNEFMRIKELNDMDEYLKCTNIQQQRLIKGLEDKVIPETSVKRLETKTKTKMKPYIRAKYKVIDLDCILPICG